MTVTVNGAEIFYTMHGNGPPCLVPSAMGTAPYERQMAPQLLDHLTMVYVDLRGGGRSTGSAADLTFDRVAEDVDAVRADLGVDRVAVLGHSILGMLALECGRRRPERVSHVITVGTPPSGDMATLSARSAAFFEAEADDERKQRMRDNLAALPHEPSMEQIMLAQTPMRFHDAGVDAAPLFAGAVPRPELLMHIMGTLAPEWTIAADPGSLTVPVLLTHGRSDYTVPHGLWDGIPATLPNATFACSRQAATSRSTRSPSGSPLRSPSGCRARARPDAHQFGPVQEHTADDDGGNTTRVRYVGEAGRGRAQDLTVSGLDGALCRHDPTYNQSVSAGEQRCAYSSPPVSSPWSCCCRCRLRHR